MQDVSSNKNKRKRSRKAGGCYHCGSDRHRGKQCPDAVCRICGETGHDVGGCPRKPLPPVNLGKFKSLEQSPSEGGFTYIELFAGMGGFRVALDRLEGRCVFSSELDRFCTKNYKVNFGDEPAGDICRIQSEQIPDHDLLVGGFPCQPFSSSGSRLGVDDPTGRGVLFREIVRILKHKQPRIFILENVRGLYLNNDGKTLKLIVQELGECGYEVMYDLIDAVKLLPQERCRLFLVGIRRDLKQEKDFEFPTLPDLERGIEDIVQVPKDSQELEKLILNPNQLSKVRAQNYTHKHPEARFLSNLKLPAKTIQSSYMKYMVGSQFIPAKGDKWRRFSSREVARLQGFPSTFKLCKDRAHHMIGNAVSPPVIAMLTAPLLQYAELCRKTNESVDWGWSVTKSMLLEAAPADSRKKNLEEKLSTVQCPVV
jgi:DNA (cytosine-5)-methyltransferase 1